MIFDRSRPVAGAGGKKKKKPKEAADNLQSTATAKLLDLLCEGEIVGLVEGARSIFLDQTAVQNADGSANFKGLTWEERTGTQDQSYIANVADGVSADINVGVAVKASSGAVVRTVAESSTDAIKVRIGVPVLRRYKSNGDIVGTEVRLQIEVKQGNGAYELRVDDTIEGKTSSLYEKEYIIAVTSGQPSYQIRLTRVTPDSDTQNLQNELRWQAYSQIVNTKLRYPNSALVGLTFDAENFSSMPERSYLIKGLIIKVPSNTTTRDDGSLVYHGTWNGTFRLSWSSNPAWCLYDLLSNKRYGTGIPEASLDKWAFYSIGQYCDELIPDGKGGVEPRFSLNCYLRDRERAYDVINTLCSVFRGMAYYDSGTVTVTQDKPRDPTRLFNDSNVTAEGFEYAGSDIRVRHNTALVTWNDPSDRYQERIEVVEDREGIIKYGVQQVEVRAVGCTSQGQAHRLGKWMLISELVETDTVTFKTAAEGIVVRPGEVIKVADRARSGVAYWGRVLRVERVSDGYNFYLDRSVEFYGGQQYYFNVVQADGVPQRIEIYPNPGSRNVVFVQSTEIIVH